MRNFEKTKLPLAVFFFVAGLLVIVQLKAYNPLLLSERFIKHSGWFEILIIALYAAYVAYKMQNPKDVPFWRSLTWSIFCIVFFAQLLLGLAVSEKFLMTGKLHLPIPAMIISGPLYRGQLSIMSLLFLSTIVLTGPAWCSHLCYFGAMDGIAAKSKKSRAPIKSKLWIKNSLLFLVIAVTLLLRVMDIAIKYAALFGIIFGLIGLMIIIFISRKKGKMFHCTLYCPIGTLVNYLRFINPFRMYIDDNCNFCTSCTITCKYDALNIADIEKKKPGITCTLCGDCLSSCHAKSIHYKLFNFNPEISRNIYLFLTISVHAVFMALARI